MSETLWSIIDYIMPIFVIILMIFVIVLIITFIRMFW